MSRYPEWWSDTITIYNKYENSQTQLITWFRTVIPKAFWKNAGNMVVINGVSLDTNSIICRIRESSNFKPKSEWIQLPNDEMDDYFTLAPGDIVVHGEAEDVIDEYTSGHRSTDLLNKYKQFGECFVIDRVADNTGTGRGQKHYFIEGK